MLHLLHNLVHGEIKQSIQKPYTFSNNFGKCTLSSAFQLLLKCVKKTTYETKMVTIHCRSAWCQPNWADSWYDDILEAGERFKLSQSYCQKSSPGNRKRTFISKAGKLMMVQEREKNNISHPNQAWVWTSRRTEKKIFLYLVRSWGGGNWVRYVSLCPTSSADVCFHPFPQTTSLQMLMNISWIFSRCANV